MRNTAVQMFATKVMALDITPKQMLYFLDWYQLALEMEKQQIKEAYKIVDLDILHEDVGEINSEQYYQETYGKNA